MAHSIKLAESFQLGDYGKTTPPIHVRKSNFSRGGNLLHLQRTNSLCQYSTTQFKKDIPVCLCGPHKADGLRAYLCDCRDCIEEERRALLKQLYNDKAKFGPSKSTRSQVASRMTETLKPQTF